MHSVSWRIHNNKVRIGKLCFPLPCLQHLQHISGIEDTVLHLIFLCIFLGGFHCLFHDFHPDCLLCHLTHQLGNGAGSGIKVVNHRLLLCIFGKAGILLYLGIELFCTQSIGLEEGKRRNFKV